MMNTVCRRKSGRCRPQAMSTPKLRGSSSLQSRRAELWDQQLGTAGKRFQEMGPEKLQTPLRPRRNQFTHTHALTPPTGAPRSRVPRTVPRWLPACCLQLFTAMQDSRLPISKWTQCDPVRSGRGPTTPVVCGPVHSEAQRCRPLEVLDSCGISQCTSLRALQIRWFR